MKKSQSQTRQLISDELVGNVGTGFSGEPTSWRLISLFRKSSGLNAASLPAVGFIIFKAPVGYKMVSSHHGDVVAGMSGNRQPLGQSGALR